MLLEQSNEALLKEKDALIEDLNSKLSQNMERNADLERRLEEMQRHIDQKHQETTSIKKQLKAFESKPREDLQKRILELQNEVQSMVERDQEACHAIEDLEIAKREIENLRRAQEVANTAIHRMQSELLQRSLKSTLNPLECGSDATELDELRIKLRDYESMKLSKDSLERRLQHIVTQEDLLSQLIAQIDAELAKVHEIVYQTDSAMLSKHASWNGAVENFLFLLRSCQEDLSLIFSQDTLFSSGAAEKLLSGRFEPNKCLTDSANIARIILECKQFNSSMTKQFLCAIEGLESDIDDIRSFAVLPNKSDLQCWPDANDFKAEYSKLRECYSKEPKECLSQVKILFYSFVPFVDKFLVHSRI